MNCVNVVHFKLVFNVAALLAFVALGPDAVAANLVNTACTSCHSLDRVNDKKADRDGWTTTVTRMKGESH